MTTYAGHRHTPNNGRECLCGCQWVEGREGVVIENTEDARKLASLGIIYVEFPKNEYHAPVTIAYGAV